MATIGFPTVEGIPLHLHARIIRIFHNPSQRDPAMAVNFRIFWLTLLAMLAFAGNSLLCRVALRHGGIDPGSFTTIRIVSGAAVLWLFLRLRRPRSPINGSWLSALALFVYAATFSFAYISLSAATGALLLFGAVQITMITYGVWRGEALRPRTLAGLIVAAAGLVGLLLPGLSVPPLSAAALMLTAGVAWGIYSLRGRGGGDPTAITGGNFVRAVLLAFALSLVLMHHARADISGASYAVASGALTSGLGYAIWYSAVRGLSATSAGVVQLSVPVIAALGGIVLLGEPVTPRLLLASTAVLGGIALVILGRSQ